MVSRQHESENPQWPKWPKWIPTSHSYFHFFLTAQNGAQKIKKYFLTLIDTVPFWEI